MNVAITVDVEKDYGGRLGESYKGVNEGLVVLTDLFKQYGVKATFFVCGKVMEDYPKQVKALEDAGHEVGMHGYDHERWTVESEEGNIWQLASKCRDVKDKSKLDIKGFRAPYLKSSKLLAGVLSSIFKYDSSTTNCLIRYNHTKLQHPYFASYFNVNQKERPEVRDSESILEIPVSSIPYFNLPLALSFLKMNYPLFKRFLKFDEERNVVMYLHPHELVDIPDLKLPFYFKKTPTKKALSIVEDLICNVFDKNDFVKMEEIYEQQC